MQWGLRHSLVAATVITSCLIGSVAVSQAAPDSKPLSLTKFTKHHGHKKLAHRHVRSSKVAKATARQQKPDKDAADNTSVPSQLPPQVADARAELSTGDVVAAKTNAAALTDDDKAASLPSNGVQVATSDQLNDMDRDAVAAPDTAADQPAPPAPAATTAAPVMKQAVERAVAATPVQQASVAHPGAWDGASLIGKIFIGLGVMLTLASAARLVIA